MKCTICGSRKKEIKLITSSGGCFCESCRDKVYIAKFDMDFIEKLYMGQYLSKDIFLCNIAKTPNFRLFYRDDYTCYICGLRASCMILRYTIYRTKIIKKISVLAPHVFKNGIYVSMNIDHVIPRSLGGTKSDFNLITTCCDCNTSKSSIIPEWLWKIMQDVCCG